MKINLTQAEAIQQLTSIMACRHNVKPETLEISIAPSTEAPSIASDLIWDATQVVKSFRDHRGANKIAAIKAVREFSAGRGSALGLAAAKNFVENVI